LSDDRFKSSARRAEFWTAKLNALATRRISALPLSSKRWLSSPMATRSSPRTSTSRIPRHCATNRQVRAMLSTRTAIAVLITPALRQIRAEPVISPRPDRAVKHRCDRRLYKERNGVERMFARLKQFRAIATRYDKTKRNFLAAIHLAAAVIWLN